MKRGGRDTVEHSHRGLGAGHTDEHRYRPAVLNRSLYSDSHWGTEYRRRSFKPPRSHSARSNPRGGNVSYESENACRVGLRVTHRS